MSAEDIGFPFAAQVARLRRQKEGRKDEQVGLITDREPQTWSALQWLGANREGWGIENGSHQRLDVTLNEDRCRVRNGNGLLVLGLFRRLAISLFIHWQIRQPKPHQKSLTDFQILMGGKQPQQSLLLPHLKTPKTPLRPSCIRAARRSPW